MLAVLLAHVLAALVAPLAVRVAGRNAFLLLALVPAASLGWVAANWGTEQRVDISWVAELHMTLDFRFDSLAGIMSLLVLGIGALVLLYCARYFDDDEPRLGLFAAELTAFAGAMFGLVTADNTLLLYLFWEATTILSFLLVGHYAERSTSRRAATQALLVTTAGGLAMLTGVIIAGQVSGTYRLSELVALAPRGWLIDVALVLILVGAVSKSALVPFHFWLPGAMAAPTPVSAYLHAAAMVKAGIYLVARLAPGFADAPPWRPMILVLGLTTMLLGGWRAMRAYDLKLVLAFGTVSQLGFLMSIVGLGSRDAMLAGLALMMAHAMFKATLFMVVGVIDHTTGTRDMRRLAHLGAKAPVLAVIATIAAASMAGLPPLIGFVAKEGALDATLHAPGLAAWQPGVVTGVVVLGSILTFGYSLRFLVGTFGRKGAAGPSKWVAEMHSAGPLFLTAPAVLTVGTIGAGLAAPRFEHLLTPYSTTIASSGSDAHLALWHGFNLPLGLTVVVIAAGLALFLAQRAYHGVLPKRGMLGNADRVYDATLRVMDEASIRLTSFTQRGSLPLTLTIILVTLTALPTIALFSAAPETVQTRLWDSPWQLPIALIMAAAALATTFMHNRLSAVLLVGVTGYGAAALFALHGAPDLALTQFLVETLTLVVFVLVLRKLPAGFEGARMGFRLPRAVLAALVGVSMTVIGAYALGARSLQPISELLPAAAYYGGNGRNTVNVLLVDVRAWDTMGEISVLLVAATGVASLVFRNRRFGSAPRVSDAPSNRSTQMSNWLAAGRLLDPGQRSLVLEVTTRLLFPTVMMLSVYFFFAGHNAPGGGFAGGLTAGLALVMRYLAGGRYELGEAVPIDAGKVLGAGLFFAGGTAVASLLLGAPVLSSATLEFTLPVFGDVKLVTALFFDLGVYLIVVGLVLDVLRSLGARLDAQIESGAPTRTRARR